MGVLFRTGSQVKDALLPFCRERGSRVEADRVVEAYVQATSGGLSAGALWEALGLSGRPEDLDREYAAGHALNPGSLEFCDRAAAAGIELACVTNHLVEWVARLRVDHGLDERIRHWVVSAEVGARKPDPRMFEALLERSGRGVAESVLVDDLPQNVEAARRFGLGAVLFGARAGPPPRARDFADLSRLLLRR
jgi:HAD superfamily hydrolase (TIGR01509 family)